tara:strand:- start:24 stop:197 length:174 start_codon:yes stop_codon:yes gene_type:complete
MKTYKVTRIETIKEEVIVKAKSEEDAINMFEDKKNENPIILSTDTNVKEENGRKEND